MPEITSDTMMQKIISNDALEGYLSGKYTDIRGCIARYGDVAHLKNPKDTFVNLRLDYNGTPYQPMSDEAVYAIKI